MVYESRVGDVFALGATSWRIEDITHDRVLVTPAPGVPGRLPFWKGDTLGRPAELGEPRSARSPASWPPFRRRRPIARARDNGLDEWAADNLVGYLTEQVEATNILPSDRHLLVERFRDELGDWRLVVHSPYGTPVHAPWALAINARLRERFGVDGQAIASDDGIVVRIPETDAEPPTGEVVVFEPDEIEEIVTAEVGGLGAVRRPGSASARPGRCCCRAATPAGAPRSGSSASGRPRCSRSPPGTPRSRSCSRRCASASRTSTTCPALVGLMRQVDRREVQVVDVATTQPSPYARSLLFGYVAQFVYEGDSPIAERRAAALSLDQGLLAELLGRAELRELLDPEVLAEVEAELQRLPPDRRARDAEGVADLLRLLGPLTTGEVTARSVDGADVAAWLQTLADAAPDRRGPGRRRGALGRRRGRRPAARRARRPGPARHARRLRRARGRPAGRPGRPLRPHPRPVHQRRGRPPPRARRRRRPPHPASGWPRRAGCSTASSARRVRHASGATPRCCAGSAAGRWPGCARRSSRSSPRRSAGSSPPGSTSPRCGAGLRGVDGVLTVVDQLAGCAGARLGAGAAGAAVAGARLRAGVLDELTSSGEVLWAGHAALPGADGWVSLAPRRPGPADPPRARAVRALRARTRRCSTRSRPAAPGSSASSPTRSGPTDDKALAAALWDLVWSGRVGNDTLAPLRSLTRSGADHPSQPAAAAPGPRPPAGCRPAAAHPRPPAAGPLLPGARHRPDPARPRRGRAAARPARRGDPRRRGERADPGRVRRASTRCSRRSRSPAAAAAATSSTGLGAAQFGTAGAIDRLRTFAEPTPTPSRSRWRSPRPTRPTRTARRCPGPSARSPRAASAAATGRAARPARSWCSSTAALDPLRRARRPHPAHLGRRPDRCSAPAAESLADAARRGTLGRLTVEKADGAQLLGSGDHPAAGGAPGRRLRRPPPRDCGSVPEGDTVWRTARSLDRALAGQVLTRTDFRVPQLATVDLTGGTVLRHRRPAASTCSPGSTRAALDAAHPPEDGGRLADLRTRSQRWRRPAHEARVVLETARRTAVGFSLGVVELLPRTAEQDAVGHLGPDLLGPDWDADEAVRRLLAQPDRGAHEALLDQTGLAGIGNLYANELCFTSGIHPRTPVGDVPDLPRLVRAGARRCSSRTRSARARPPPATCASPPGSTAATSGQCRRCGTPIEVGGRRAPTDASGRRTGARVPVRDDCAMTAEMRRARRRRASTGGCDSGGGGDDLVAAPTRRR